MAENAASGQSERLTLHNSMEDVVIDKAKSIIAKMDICQCEKCFWDICSLVLNKVPPKYVTTSKGKLMAKLPEMSHKKEAELTMLITQSAKMVHEKPMH